MQIEDGTGSGKTAGVNADNKLEVVAITASTEHETNHHNGLAFNVLFEQTPLEQNPSIDSTVESCIFYMQNTSEIDMTIEGVTHRLAGTVLVDILEIRGGETGVPIGGATVTPVNLNLSSGNSAIGIFLAGDDITGLSGGVVLQRIYIASDGSQYHNFDQDIIVPRNRIITIYSMTPVAQISATVSFNYHPSIGTK